MTVDRFRLDGNVALVTGASRGLGAAMAVGIIRRKPAAEHGDDDWDAVIEVNLSSVFRMCRAAARHMLERGGGGKIVNVASLLSFQGGITVPGYAAAKGGIAQLTKALANEWAPRGINVNAIAPDDLAGAIVFLASRASDYVHGHVLVVDGGWMGR